MLRFYFPDNRFPEAPLNHTRPIARAIVLDEEGKVILNLVHRDDMFGNQTCYETPGGGIDEGETPEEAVVRECEEEIGAKVEILAPLCIVEDAYSLIGRKNVGYYFLVQIKERTRIHHESEGDDFIVKNVAFSLDEAISAMKNQPDDGFSGLVKQRELPVLLLAKRRIEKGNP